MSVVRKIRFPQTTGEECPRPGTSAFQATLRSAVQEDGRVRSWETPLAGPRQFGQTSRVSDAATAAVIRNRAGIRCIILESHSLETCVLPQGHILMFQGL